MTRTAAATLTAWCALFAGITPATACPRPDGTDRDRIAPIFSSSDRVESYPSPGGAFRVHFTRAGAHAVPARDDDRDDVPDLVQQIAAQYDAVLAHYEGAGYEGVVADGTLTCNGGDARFDVYLLDFATTADGAYRRHSCTGSEPERCSGFIAQENDFVGRPYPNALTGVRVLASHEYFHAIQAAYHAGAGAVVSESTAVVASDLFDPSLREVESFAAGYLQRTNRSLDQEPTTAVDSFAYGASFVFDMLVRRHDAAIVRELWEELRDAPNGGWLAALDEVLQTRGSSLADALLDLAAWNLFTGRRADPARGFPRGSRLPLVTENEVVLPYTDSLVRSFHASIRYYVAERGGRGELGLAVVGPETTGLVLMAALESSTGIERIESGAPTVPLVLSASASTQRVHAILVDTRTDGASLRVGFCAGDRGEIERCRAELGASALDGGVDMSDGGSTLPPPRSGGGCQAAASQRGRAALPDALLILIGVLLAFAWAGPRRSRLSPAPRTVRAPHRHGRARVQHCAGTAA